MKTVARLLLMALLASSLYGLPPRPAQGTKGKKKDDTQESGAKRGLKSAKEHTGGALHKAKRTIKKGTKKGKDKTGAGLHKAKEKTAEKTGHSKDDRYIQRH